MSMKLLKKPSPNMSLSIPLMDKSEHAMNFENKVLQAVFVLSGYVMIWRTSKSV
ncbi:hypothetical protein THIOSC15_730004 [uncultured Thiomicrorhabdus sp.]